MNQQKNTQTAANLDEELENIKLEKTVANIKNTILILSGKGGVGKSTIAANLATHLSLLGKRVGLLDVDLHGPSIPKLMGLEKEKVVTDESLLIPLGYGKNLKVMSLGFLLQNDDAVIWQGPLKNTAIKQLVKDVKWGELDYLIIDSPPGTGDEPLSIIQLLKKPTGAIIVTQPQDVSVSDVRRSVNFCKKMQLPVIGIVENMSGFKCPHCNEVVDIFKQGGGEELAKEFNVNFLGKIPLDPQVVKSGDAGEPFTYFYGKTETAKRFEEITEQLINKVEINEEIPKMAEKTKRYAIPVANGNLCQHFGHCEHFALVDVDDETKTVISVDFQSPPPHEPGVLPQWCFENKVEVVIAGGMGSRAQNLFTEKGIQVIVGAPVGDPKDVVTKHLNGEFVAGDNVCDH